MRTPFSSMEIHWPQVAYQRPQRAVTRVMESPCECCQGRTILVPSAACLYRRPLCLPASPPPYYASVHLYLTDSIRQTRENSNKPLNWKRTNPLGEVCIKVNVKPFLSVSSSVTKTTRSAQSDWYLGFENFTSADQEEERDWRITFVCLFVSYLQRDI